MFRFNRTMHWLAYQYCLLVWLITKPFVTVCVLWFESSVTNRKYWSHTLSKEISETRDILNQIKEAQ